MYAEIARNKHRSIAFVGLFFVVWLGLGVAIGLLWRALSSSSVDSSAPSRHVGSGWTPVAVTVTVCALVAIAGVLYSLTAGAGLVLRASGAKPAEGSEFTQLHNLVGALAIGEGIPKPAVYVIDDASPNAFATGVSPEKAAITFTSGLLALMNREELEGVISHEMSHIKNHDIRLLLVVGTLIGLAALLSSILWRTAFWGSIGEDDNGGSQFVIVILVASALLAVVGFLFGPLVRLALSRRRESLADASGVELTRNPAGLLGALKKLQDNDEPFKMMNHATAAMCIDDPLQHHESWVHHLYDTHPPIAQRIAELERLALGISV
jgi:heat shock protein HtpX